MKRLALLALACIISASLTACKGITDTDRAQTERRFSDTPAMLKCYDFGILVYEGRSRGKPQRDDTGDGMWTFVDTATGNLTTVEGNCVVFYS